MFLSVYLFVSPDITCPGLPHTFFFAYKMPDLFRKTILTILNMLSADPAFCERLYLCDFDRGSIQSMEVVQTFNRTLLSDQAAYRVCNFEIPRKFKAERKNIMSMRPQNAKCHA